MSRGQNSVKWDYIEVLYGILVESMLGFTQRGFDHSSHTPVSSMNGFAAKIMGALRTENAWARSGALRNKTERITRSAVVSWI